ncbi:MAG TPA: DUF47 family protein [Armatimonadota bacterium]
MLRLVPKQESFFELFEKQVHMVDHAAHGLVALLSDYRDVEDAAFKVKATEHDADEIAHQIMRKVNTTFVTPLDREDIHAIVSAMDDIIDSIEAAVDRMALYAITKPTDAATKMAVILAEATALTVKAVEGLRDMKNFDPIHRACVAINRLENQGDQVNRTALAKLFQMHDQPMEALKWREIYGHIETAIDKCEDVADILESITLKNA